VIIQSTTESLAFIMLIGIAVMSILFGIAFSDEAQPKTSINLVSNRNDATRCEFQVPGAGEFDCSGSEGEGIFVESVCKSAAEALGYHWKGVERWGANWPKGCYVYGNGANEYGGEWSGINVYFSEHETGAANSLTSPICKVTGSEACKTANVGSSSCNAKTIDFDDSFRCPAKVSKINWENNEDYGDTFTVAQADGTLFVARTDNDNGWGMEMEFKCCTCY